MGDPAGVRRLAAESSRLAPPKYTLISNAYGGNAMTVFYAWHIESKPQVPRTIGLSRSAALTGTIPCTPERCAPGAFGETLAAAVKARAARRVIID